MGFYEEYINSDTWKKKRQERLEIDGYTCQVGDCTEDLEVHHKHYRSLGNENVREDLITLCRTHHDAITNVNRQQRYANKDISITITDEIDYRRQNYVDRKTIQINWHSPDDSSQRTDGRSYEQVFQDDKTNFIEEKENRR